MTDEEKAFDGFREQHDMISQMVKYPPFSTDNRIFDAVQDELDNLPSVGNPPNLETLKSYYQPIYEKFATEFEEASLWQSRYPLDRYEAARAALELEGIPDWEIDIRLISI